MEEIVQYRYIFGIDFSIIPKYRFRFGKYCMAYLGLRLMKIGYNFVANLFDCIVVMCTDRQTETTRLDENINAQKCLNEECTHQKLIKKKKVLDAYK